MPGLLRGVARTAVIAGTATHVSNNVSRRQANRWAEQDQAQSYEEAPPQQAAPAPAGDDKLDQLQKMLADYEAGVAEADLLRRP